MGKRLLASFLAAAMMLTMAPFAFAIENTEDTIDADQIPAAEEAVDEENQIETQSESDLQQAINNAEDGSIVTMSENEKADITINKNITLDLNNKTLTNTDAGKATITVTDGATVTVKSGTVMGGTSYYNIQVGTAVNSTANLTLEGVTATAGNTGSSMIDNRGTLTIESGTYTGGLNVVKSEEGSNLTITGGKFTLEKANSYTAAILSYGQTLIVDGEFIQNATGKWAYSYPVVVGTVDGYSSLTKITGGKFANKSGSSRVSGVWAYSPADENNLQISGGTFDKRDSKTFSKFIAEGYGVDSKTGEIKTAVTSVTLDKTELTLKAGLSDTLKATVGPESADIKTVTWTSADPKIATVLSTGKITGVKNGTTQIIATPAGSKTGVPCTVTVTMGDAAVGEKQYATLADAISKGMLTSGKTVTLLTDVTESVTFPNIKRNYTLNLNGHTITNAAGGDTITVGAKANLTIQGEGTVDNVTHGKAAIYNNGTVTLNGGTYTRSLETGDKVTLKNTYYNILNHGIMTINNGVTVKQDGNYSSLVANGYYNYKDINAGERTAYIEGTGQANPKLIINGGNFSGGINTIKNDDGAELTIQDGTFRNATQYVVMNNNIAAINGGKFEGLNNDMEVVYTQYYAGGVNAGKLSITGGNFVGKITGNASANIKISNGVFSVQPDAKYLAPGYKAEQTNGVWVVKSGTNDAISAIDAALEAVKNDKPVSQEDTKKAVTDAVTAVKDIPNDKLTDTTTMDKLAKLEEAYKAANTDNAITVKVENADTVETKVADNGVKNAALSADAGQTVTINVDKNTTDAENVANAIKTATGSEETPNVEALDITMKIGETVTQPKAPVVLTFELPGGKDNAQIYRIEGNTATKIPTTLNVNAEGKRTISGTFDHFSTYGIQYLNATANDNQYEFILTPDKTDVSAGDEITYTVMLKHNAGDTSDAVGTANITPTMPTGLTIERFTESTTITNPETVEYTNGTIKFKALAAGHNLGVGNSITLGTITCKVADCGDDLDKVSITGTTTLTNHTYQEEITPTVSAGTVTYHEIEVTFQQDDVRANDKVYYAKYNEAKLYSDAAHTTEATIAAPTNNSTEYRLLDNQWHATTAEGPAYEANTTKFITSMTYVTNRIGLLEITIPTDSENNPQVTVNGTADHPLTERNGTKYVDEKAPLTFTVVDHPTAGKKYDVTVKVNGNAVTATKNADGSYTVAASEMTASPVTFEVNEVLDLDASDIGIFTTTENNVRSFVKYSKYSKTDTLVLIKGKTGADGNLVNYELNNGTKIYKTTAYDGYTHAVLLPMEYFTVGSTDEDAKQSVLTYLVGTLGLAVTNTPNESVDSTSWDTNGNNRGTIENPDYGDIQAANDFNQTETLKWTPSDKLLLLADTLNLKASGNRNDAGDYSVARDGHVTNSDVNAFVYLYGGYTK